MPTRGKASVFVYGLCAPDPHHLKVMYVGCTGQHLHNRLQGHIHEAMAADDPATPKLVWIRGLIAEGLEPVVVLLEQVKAGQNWEEREQYWISFFGGTDSLLNLTGGGIGAKQLVAEVRGRISSKTKGRKLSLEHRCAISEGNLGKKHTDAARAKISATRKERIAAKLITMPQAAGCAAAAEKISGSMWINDGTQNKRVPQGAPLPLGWSQGRALSARQSEMYSQRRKANNPEN